jgi:uncharacterized protein YycO
MESRIINLLFFPFIILILTALIVIQNFHVITNEDSVMYIYLKNAVQGRFGGGYSQTGNNVSFAGLEPGDLILGAYGNGTFGYFSHAGIYAGDGLVLESYLDYGVTEHHVSSFRKFNDICLLRVNADPEVKAAAVEYVRQMKGRLFYPVAFKPGESFFNCTKIMWKAYMGQGIDLTPVDDLWIAPDAFYSSPMVTIIKEPVHKKG